MLISRNLCTGCGACAVSCPQNCIEMLADQEGFRYPEIDLERCISCHRCEQVCPMLNKKAPQADTQAFAVRHMDEDIRRRSSSGGVFPALASSVIENSGVVCGAVYTENFTVEHVIIETVSEISRLQGAKYAQSKAEHLFPVIRNMLDVGRMVLFSGTPCQVAGLSAYLNKAYDNLLLVDMICHGVPSPLVWSKYLGFRSAKDAGNAKIASVNQRDKQSGWSKYRYSISIAYENGAWYSSPQSSDMFMRGFVNNLYLRPSCAQCQLKGIQRNADITLGDYWGVWDQHPDFDDDKGISVALVHTAKGMEFWQKIGCCVDAVPISTQEAVKQNPSALESAMPHQNREQFFNLMDSSDFDGLVSALLLGQETKRNSLKSMIKKLLKF